MKKTRVLSALCLLFCAVAIFTGCSADTPGQSIGDEPEITVKYLTGEYADQLIRDGGVHHFGSLTVKKTDNGTYETQIQSKKFVESDEHKKGYYIADRNLTLSLPCNPEARVTYLTENGKAPQVITIDEFIQYTSDEQTNEKKLYDIYEIGGSVELILAKELK